MSSRAPFPLEPQPPSVERSKEDALSWINAFMGEEYDESTDRNQELRKYILYSNSGSLIKDIMGGVSDQRVLERVKKWFLRRGKPPSEPLEGEYTALHMVVPRILKFKQVPPKPQADKASRPPTRVHRMNSSSNPTTSNPTHIPTYIPTYIPHIYYIYHTCWKHSHSFVHFGTPSLSFDSGAKNLSGRICGRGVWNKSTGRAHPLG
jgi:hypothetical protein